ncbi:Rad4 beta-hairpin domain 3-domain-containing protein, partial [Phyllosticta capitalensis]|uniref:Rad4 beta-hairpin domain 3-domain-containing protein n=1 Tax=Phyllosticta capitalensis TaxID=121624 RepID=UPI0031314759
MDWEDALPATAEIPATNTQTKPAPWRTLAGATDDALEITLGTPQEQEDEAARTKALGIKGPSKKDRQLRMWTHCVHVQCLLFHNALRNAWCCDEKVHEVLLKDVPDGVRSEVQRWRQDSDPLNRLLKYLAAYWKKRFRITAPGLRKKGYYPSAKSLATEDDQDFGEIIRNKDEFLDAARRCEGSRDVGAQLFTALLRGLGLEARLVCNLQPLGFGFTKAEDIPIPRQSGKKFDTDLPFPIYWTEVLSPITHTYTAVSPLVISTVASTSDLLASFEPRGAAADKAKQIIAYVVAHSQDGTAKDVTVRYLKKHKIPIHNRRGKVKRYEDYDWFKDVMRCYTKDGLQRTKADEVEDEGDLVPVKPAKAKKDTGEVPETLQGYKNSAEYVLERHLRREEAIRPGAKPVKTFTTGKGDKAKSEPVYLRKDVKTCKTVESWHKEGRQIKLGEQPMKHVPTRAVTLVRKLEIEAAERESGEKPTQGLYAEEQTEWIIPPPIEDGVIPKNAFGNMDVYVPTMVPQGAVHIPFRSTAPICRKLGIDYAEACTGFEFGNRRAVPILTGVVVAEENEQLVKDAWRAAQEAQKAKADKKRQDRALKMWKKFILGLRIIERVREEY